MDSFAVEVANNLRSVTETGQRDQRRGASGKKWGRASGGGARPFWFRLWMQVKFL